MWILSSLPFLFLLWGKVVLFLQLQTTTDSQLLAMATDEDFVLGREQSGHCSHQAIPFLPFRYSPLSHSSYRVVTLHETLHETLD